MLALLRLCFTDKTVALSALGAIKSRTQEDHQVAASDEHLDSSRCLREAALSLWDCFNRFRREDRPLK
jgi:hypothetical protein